MKRYSVILIILAGLAAIGIPLWAMFMPAPKPASDKNTPPVPASAPALGAIRLDVTPARNPVDQLRRYRAFGDYLTHKLGRPVDFNVVNTYQSVLSDFREKEAEGAFLGSMVALLAMDRLGAEVLLKPQTPEGISTYRGVIMVPESSAIRSVADLAGHSLGMVRTTTAGNLYPIFVLKQRGMLGCADCPYPVWAGTFDEVIENVMAGRLDAGAVKDVRLTALLAAHPAWKVRQLAVGDPVPNNSLVLRGDVAADLGPKLRAILLAMPNEADGRQALEQLGVARFIPCDLPEFEPVFRMAEAPGPDWAQVGVEGPPPRRPSEPAATAPDPTPGLPR